MSDIKSYQRLLAVQALYEFTINKRGMDDTFDELLLHIVENSDFKNKINNSKLLLTKEILKGVYFNLKKIDLILKSSLKDKIKVQLFDKLLFLFLIALIISFLSEKKIFLFPISCVFSWPFPATNKISPEFKL